MRSSRVAVVTAAIVAMTVSPLLPAAHAAGPVTDPVTVAKVVSPVDEHNRLADGYTIAHHYSDANCESGSPTTGTSYQCFSPQSPDGIYNSCWVQINKNFVLCLVKPWEHKVVRLHVTRGYGNSAGFSKVKRPWGLRLADGNRCLVILAPVHIAHGKRINYYCQHKIALGGAVNKRHDTWTISGFRKVKHHRRPTTFAPIATQQIEIAWSGGPSTQAGRPA